MTIEVRQLLIKSTVGEERKPDEEQKAKLPTEELARLKEDVLADCKAWLMEKLGDARER
jgi:hypothetical protein